MLRIYVLIYSRTELQLHDLLTPRPIIQSVLLCRLVPVAPIGLALVTGILA